MKKIFLLAFCCWSCITYAQHGFFLQPEIGAGVSNTNWRPTSTTGSIPGQQYVFSYQGQIDIGYRTGKWQFISGLGYLRTGVKLQNGDLGNFSNFVMVYPLNEAFLPVYMNGITAYDPHIIVPLKIGYKFCQLGKKLSFDPLIGGAYSFNQRRTFVYSYQGTKEKEPMFSFTDNCNQRGFLGLAELNFDYRMNNRYELTFGPSVHYMFTSELNFKDQHDYAVLLNLGLKWNFKRSSQNL